MKRIISALMASSLLLAGQAYAADGVVFDGGDVRISPGNALVFQDGTTQTTATLQGPANTLAIGTVTTGASGSQAAATITGTSPNQVLNLTIPQGPQGIQGTAGVTNGITKGVHGTVVGANVPSNSNNPVNGTGFYVNRTISAQPGSYNITFNPAFSTPPDCVITPVGHFYDPVTTQYAYIACEVSTLDAPTFSAEKATVECRFYRGLAATPTLIDTTFTFICVE
jgi:hypothetical protein